MIKYLLAFFVIQLLLQNQSFANLELLCDKLKIEGCERRNYSRSSGASRPTEQSSYSVNPSAIPVEKGLGLETIYNDGDFNFGLVTGTGKVGAAVGPNSIEDSFFGNMAVEDTLDYENRLLARKKYKSKKTVVATAISLYNKRLVKLNLGVIGRYNRPTGNLRTGVGLSAQLGIFNIGYSKYKDEFYYADLDLLYPYEATITTLGMKVPYLAVDYSYVKNKFQVIDLETNITILSMTAFWRKLMITYATRKEISYRPKFDFKAQTFDYVEEKNAGFMGFQYSVNKKIIVGAFYNYFLLEDWSLGLTVFL